MSSAIAERAALDPVALGIARVLLRLAVQVECVRLRYARWHPAFLAARAFGSLSSRAILASADLLGRYVRHRQSIEALRKGAEVTRALQIPSEIQDYLPEEQAYALTEEAEGAPV